MSTHIAGTPIDDRPGSLGSDFTASNLKPRAADWAIRPGLHPGLILFSLLLAVPLFAAWRALFSQFIFDDAYIAYRFSENLAAGHGLTWNPGTDPVEGFTSFVWVVMGAAAQVITGLRPHEFMPHIGGVSWLLLVAIVVPSAAVALMSDWHDDSARRVKALLAALAVLTLAANPYLGFHAFHGLETSLYSLLLCTLAYVAVLPSTERSIAALAVLSWVCYAVRPDAVTLLVPLWLGTLLWAPAPRRRLSLIWAAALMLALIAYVATKWVYFGHPVPNTFYIKQGGWLTGAGYVRAYAAGLAPLLVLVAYVGGRVGLARLLRDRQLMLLVGPAAVFALGYLNVNPILGHGYRFLIATLPLFVLGAFRLAVLCETLRPELATSASGRRHWSISAGVYAFTIVFVLAWADYRVLRTYAGWNDYFSALRGPMVTIGQGLERASALTPAPLLATADIGAVSYFSRLPVLDLIGLTDERVAHDGLTHEYLAERKPDLIILQDLYTVTAPGEDAPSAAGAQTAIVLDGSSRVLNVERYSDQIRRAAERVRSGGGTTFQVVTAPFFARDYVHAADWAIGTIDRFYVFVRRESPHFRELFAIVRDIRE